MLRIAIQKKGRLYDESTDLLKEIGLKISGNQSALKVSAKNFPLEILFLRNSDIPKYVESGIVDLGIIGENTLLEKEKNVNTVMQLGFSKCRLSLAVPKDQEYNGIGFFQGKRIATSYPNSLSKYLKEKNIQCEIHEIAGSVEVAPSIGLSDGICDLVESGNTLFVNGMKEVEVMSHSQAVLISTHNLSSEKQTLLDQITFRIESTQRAKEYKYIVFNIPNDKIVAASQMLPSMKSPTVVPLNLENWSAIHSVLKEADFWQSIEQLKSIGAQGILVMPIEKMIL
ncbi:MAG: ATP phosphoribosyltransferase [Flavobacteriaceae bacterium]|nr:MAG: ATP phosphoribosyltransferase [Flavobacteriaceae bacterium]